MIEIERKKNNQENLEKNKLQRKISKRKKIKFFALIDSH